MALVVTGAPRLNARTVGFGPRLAGFGRGNPPGVRPQRRTLVRRARRILCLSQRLLKLGCFSLRHVGGGLAATTVTRRRLARLGCRLCGLGGGPCGALSLGLSERDLVGVSLRRGLRGVELGSGRVGRIERDGLPVFRGTLVLCEPILRQPRRDDGQVIDAGDTSEGRVVRNDRVNVGVGDGRADVEGGERLQHGRRVA